MIGEPSLSPVPQPSPVCEKCGGERIATQVIAGGAYMVLKEPTVMFGHTSRLTAYMCTHCGFTELYAEYPQDVIVRRPDNPAR